MKSLKQGDIVLVRFPYSDFQKLKLRPALVVSGQALEKYDDLVILGITSAKLGDKKLEVDINNEDLIQGALPKKSYIRVSKIVSLEKKLVIKKVAHLNEEKLNEILEKLGLVF